MISHCRFDLYFSNNEQCWAPFHVFISHLYVFFGELSFPTVDWVVCFSGIELYELLVYFGNWSFVSCFICSYFLPFWGLSLHLAYSFLCCAKAFKFNQVPLVYFCFYSPYSRKRIIEDLALIYFIKCSAYVFQKSFIISGLTFRSLIYFEFTLVYGIRKCSNFTLLHVSFQFSQHHLLKRLSLPHCVFLPPLSKQGTHRYMGLFLGFLSCSVGLYFCFCASTILSWWLLLIKSKRLISPAPFFFLKIALAIWDLLCFHMNCEIYCSSSVKNAIGNLTRIALNL